MGTWYRVTFLRFEYSLQRPVETQFHGESFETLQVRRFPSSLTAIDRLTSRSNRKTRRRVKFETRADSLLEQVAQLV